MTQDLTYSEKIQLYITYQIVKYLNTKHIRSPIQTKKDTSSFVNINEVDGTIPIESNIMIATPPKSERNLIRRYLFKLLATRKPKLEAPNYNNKNMVEFTDISVNINKYWNYKFNKSFTFPILDYSNPFDLLQYIITIDPVKALFVDNVLDISHLSKYSTMKRSDNPQDDYLNGGIVTIDGETKRILTITTPHFGTIELNNKGEITDMTLNGTLSISTDGTAEGGTVWTSEDDDEWALHGSAAMFCKSLAIHCVAQKHLFECHLLTSVKLSSKLIQRTEPSSPIRRLMTPFMYDAISLIYDQVNLLTNLDSGFVKKMSNFEDNSILEYYQHMINNHNMYDEYIFATTHYSKYYAIFENLVMAFIDNDTNVDTNVDTTGRATNGVSTDVQTDMQTDVITEGDSIKEDLFDCPQLNLIQQLATFIFISTVKHGLYGNMIDDIFPYINLEVDLTNRKIYVNDIMGDLTIVYITHAHKNMLTDDYTYLCETENEVTAFKEFNDDLIELDKDETQIDPDTLDASVNE